ncbi:MAG: hypothetical protein JXO49_08825 [Deltaproteobacteria bacterium]|nr:hypothetical protein [Candidatus Anaeroferrophillus wilburensis]MBN2889432.1 hypothetical protein [Deltaproteobacteria bacterium]
MNRCIWWDTRGVSLIAAVFMILILSFLGLVMLAMSTLADKESTNELFSTRAYYGACAAGEVAVVMLDQGVIAGPGETHMQFDQSRAVVACRQDAPGYWQLTATGTGGNESTSDYARRSMVIKFKK